MKTLLACGVVLMSPAMAQTQTIEIVVQGVPPSGPVIPVTDAIVRASQSPNQQGGSPRPPVIPVQSTSDPNVYTLSPAALGSPIDITIRRSRDYHSWVVNDIFLSPGRDQRIEVQLFHFGYPIRAPQCFALKTQYERLYRKIEQLNPGRPTTEIQRMARLEYGDALFALPNPNREHLQSQQTRRMLAEMRDEQRGELGAMMGDLFKLYRLDRLADFVPSEWDTNYVVNGQRVGAKVRLLGTHGTYQVNGETHRLEEVDVAYSERDEAFFITGKFRFKPDTPNESTGSFRWRLSGEENSFQGTPQWSGRLIRGPWDDPN